MQDFTGKLRISAVFLLAILFIGAAPASASVLYDNGALNGAVDAWAINFGFSISDSFVLPAGNHPFTLQGFDFVVWASPGDKLNSVGWSVTSAPFGGATYLSGTNTVPQTFLSSNVYGYDLDRETFSIPDFLLPTGTYWFQLKNAVVANGDPVYWDQNDGRSQAFDQSLGNLSTAGPGLGYPCSGNCSYSETFQVLGHAPEPAGFLLMGTGLVGLAILLKHRIAK